MPGTPQAYTHTHSLSHIFWFLCTFTTNHCKVTLSPFEHAEGFFPARGKVLKWWVFILLCFLNHIKDAIFYFKEGGQQYSKCREQKKTQGAFFLKTLEDSLLNLISIPGSHLSSTNTREAFSDTQGKKDIKYVFLNNNFSWKFSCWKLFLGLFCKFDWGQFLLRWTSFLLSVGTSFPLPDLICLLSVKWMD